MTTPNYLKQEILFFIFLKALCDLLGLSFLTSDFSNRPFEWAFTNLRTISLFFLLREPSPATSKSLCSFLISSLPQTYLYSSFSRYLKSYFEHKDSSIEHSRMMSLWSFFLRSAALNSWYFRVMLLFLWFDLQSCSEE